LSADLAARLRVLAQDYGEGKLSLATYRRLRAPLIDSLELHGRSSGDDDAITRPRAVQRAAEPAAPAERETPPAPKRNFPTLIVVLGVAIAATVAVWLSRSGDGASSVPSAQENAVETLVRAFEEGGDWSDSRIAAFNAALNSLGPQRLGEAASEPAFRRFVEEVRRRFKEQQALAGAPLTRESSALAALAETLGLDLDSPDAAIRIAPAPLPAPPPATAHVEAPPPAHTKVVPAPKPVTEAQDRAAPSVAPTRPEARSAPATRVASGGSAASATAPANPSEDPCKATLIGTRRPVCHDSLPSGDAGPELALVPAGNFEMGSTAAAEEQPVHRVSIAKSFAISIHEVSQAEFSLYCERARTSCAAQPWSGEDYPVVNVSWNDARAYAEWLSSATHRHYRLPTEAEWEYAARAGESGAFPSGETLSPTDAWFSHNESADKPARRSQRFNPNRFRLLHTVGNVREWVQDAWTEDFKAAPVSGVRVVRGGSHAEGAARLRLSMREGLPEGTRDVLTGFRVVRDLQ
jgi:formylglycine-generating enzyme required for sulfatase activity